MNNEQLKEQQSSMKMIRSDDMYEQLKKADDLLVCVIAYLYNKESDNEQFLSSELWCNLLKFTNMEQYFKIIKRKNFMS